VLSSVGVENRWKELSGGAGMDAGNRGGHTEEEPETLVPRALPKKIQLGPTRQRYVVAEGLSVLTTDQDYILEVIVTYVHPCTCSHQLKREWIKYQRQGLYC
jgi:hypothetical protein